MNVSSVALSAGRGEPTEIVRTSLGPIRGFRHQLSNGQEARIFLGIPFAKPPVRELRFERPVQPEPWTDVLEAFEFGPASIGVDMAFWEAQPCSEDCLQLNIFSPIIPDEGMRLPVLFYVHGGGFCSGSTREYGYQGWVDNFLSEGLLIVTVQYRLGPFGFFTLGDDSSFPGNLGLWDLALALQFVYENIAQFGGDPYRITVVGLSAGGAAAAMLALSPWTRDWVWASVQMSGTALAEWAVSEQTVQSGKDFACRALGLREKQQWKNLDLHQVKKRLQAMSVKEIQQIITDIGTTRAEPNLLIWSPRVDGHFLPKDIPALIQDLTEAKPALLGLTEMESIYFAIQDKDKFLNPFGIPRSRMAFFGVDHFREFVHTCVLATAKRHLKAKMELDPKRLLEVEIEMGEDICRFYLDNIALVDRQKENTDWTSSTDVAAKISKEDGSCLEEADEDFKSQYETPFVLEQYTRLISDMLFNVPLFWMVQLRRQNKLPSFLYLNKYFNPEQFEAWIPLKLKGSTHSNEYPYMNGLFPIGEFEFTEYDKVHRRVLVQMLSDFVHTRVPSAKGLQDWPSNIGEKLNEESDESSALQFVMIQNEDSKCSILKRMETMEESCQFWTRFIRKYGFNPIRGVARDKIVANKDPCSVPHFHPV